MGRGETTPGIDASFNVGGGETTPGIDFSVGRGETTPGIDASFNVGGGETTPGIDFSVGRGETTPGIDASFNVGGGETTPGIEKPFWADRECVEGAATALIAQRARAEPRATHETFNHDECILDSPQLVATELLED